ncbi:MAG TPA: hypothetical protein VIW68_14710 [Candidatus Sulfotelmatobacter sp.]
MAHNHPTRLLLGVLFLEAVLCAQSQKSNSTNTTYVGLLDDAREEVLNWKPVVASQRFIRPAFEKTPSGWKKVDPSSLPARLKWTIAFDGKMLGHVEAQTASDDWLTPVQSILVSSEPVPSIGSPSTMFAGLAVEKVRRPLVAISRPNFRDPDGWKRMPMPRETAALVIKAFRHDYPHVDRCGNEEIVERDWKFPDSALSFPIAYGSNKHSFLIKTSLNAGNCGYVSDPDDPTSEPWFFVDPDGTARRIGSFLTLLDAGDYDGDGKSEVVFFLMQGENTDGFVLFDPTFPKPVTLDWHYH